jgi:hypothetical protein
MSCWPASPHGGWGAGRYPRSKEHQGGANRPSRLRVILNPAPDICRLGYGELGAIEYLMEAGISMHKAAGLKLGVLVADDHAWIFAPTPCVIEEPAADGTTNAIAINISEAQRLVRAISSDPEPATEAASRLAGGESEPELPIAAITTEDLGLARKDLKECPPQRFDLARRVRVYQAYVQFVELSLTGVHIQRHTVRLPKDLLGISEDGQIQERLKASFRLIDKDSAISSKGIENRVARLRKIYLRSLGKKFGVVILRRKKDDFLREVDAISHEIDDFGKTITSQLAADFDKCKVTLISTFKPMVIAKPPDRLRGGIPSGKPSEEQAERFLTLALEDVFPDPSEIIREMKLDCVFKDVTYEVLNDPEFQTSLEEKYPLIRWPKPYEEFEAARQNSG